MFWFVWYFNDYASANPYAFKLNPFYNFLHMSEIKVKNILIKWNNNIWNFNNYINLIITIGIISASMWSSIKLNNSVKG